MAKPPIAVKNLQGLTELMSMEQLAYKKFDAYAKAFNDAPLRDLCTSHAKLHRERFESMLGYLNTHE